MGDVIRLNNNNSDLLSSYYDLLLQVYGDDTSLVPDKDDINALLRCALNDAIRLRNNFLPSYI